MTEQLHGEVSVSTYHRLLSAALRLSLANVSIPSFTRGRREVRPKERRARPSRMRQSRHNRPPRLRIRASRSETAAAGNATEL